MAGDTRTRMVDTAARLLQYRGYYGTSLNDILSESAAPRGSLYFHFPGGKDELVIEATRATIALASQQLAQALAAGRTPGADVRLYADAAAEIMRQSDFTFGCPVAPVILDAAGDVSELAELCRQAFLDWTAAMRDRFVAAGIAARRAQSLATMALSAIEGALVVARAHRDETALRQVGKELETLIDGAVPPSKAQPAPRRRRKTA